MGGQPGRRGQTAQHRLLVPQPEVTLDCSGWRRGWCVWVSRRQMRGHVSHAHMYTTSHMYMSPNNMQTHNLTQVHDIICICMHGQTCTYHHVHTT